MGDVLLVNEGCLKCGREFGLYARIKGRAYCAACWRKAGCPVGDDVPQKVRKGKR